MTMKPSFVLINKKTLSETNNRNQEGWIWESIEKGGMLTIRHQTGNLVSVIGN